MTLNKSHNLNISPGVSSSRFVIDLKQNLCEEKNQPVKKSENFEEKIEKLAEIDYGKYFKAGKKKVGEIFIKGLASNIKSFWIAGPSVASADAKATADEKALAGKQARNDNNLINLSNQFTFIVLGKILYVIIKKFFILFYKICYAIGWSIVFILRLIYFFILAVISPLKKFLYILFVKFQPAVNKISKHTPRDLQAKETAAISMLMKFFNFLKGFLAPKSKKLAKFNDEKINKFSFFNWRQNNFKISYLKSTIIFSGILLILILPVKAFSYFKIIETVKGKVLGASEIAMDNLISAGESIKNLYFDQAGQGFTAAGDNFLKAQKEMDEINSLLLVLASVAPNKNIQLAAAGKNILRAGELSSKAGKNLSLAMDSLFNYEENNTNNSLANLTLYGHKAINNLADLTITLDQINTNLIPEDYQKQFILLKQKTAELNKALKEFINLADSLNSFLGNSIDKRYLLVFQNNSELRASGGFIGSFALIDFSKGEIKNIEVPGGGSYDTEAGFLKKIKAPEPLSLVRYDWHFWDANWWPDWPTSARKLAWFYENSDGSTVDGVLSFTPTIIEKLLRIIGPIDLSDQYGSTSLTTGGLIIDADNFWFETQKLAEQKPDVTREPKKIIGDLMNKIIEELPKRLTKNNLVPLFKVLEESLSSKNVLFYFTDKDLEAKADDLGWSGRIKNTSGDYLSVINTNIAGGKSDRKIKQEIIQRTVVQVDGSIINDLTIRRSHEAIKRELFSGVRNVDWLRVYVPLGSELIEANGFKPVDKIFFDEKMDGLEDDPDVLAGEGRAETDELTGTKIYNELGKTVFANWTQLDPGETIEINIKYKLPFKLYDKKQTTINSFTDNLATKVGAILNPDESNLYSYSLLVQKQPGMNSSTIETELVLENNFRSIWKYPDNLNDSGQNGWSISEDLDQDKIIGIIVEEK